MYVFSLILLCAIQRSESQNVTLPLRQSHSETQKSSDRTEPTTVSDCCGGADVHQSDARKQMSRVQPQQTPECLDIPSQRTEEGDPLNISVAECCRLYLSVRPNLTDPRNVPDELSVQSEVQLHEELPRDGEVWGYGILFTTIINLSSVAGAVFLPLTRTKYYPLVMTTFIGLAVGSLVSASVLHLLPQAFEVTSNPEESKKYLMVGITVLLGIYLFFLIERTLKFCIEVKKARRKVHMELATAAETAPGLDLVISDSTVNKQETIGFISGEKVIRESGDDRVHNLPPVVWMIIIGDGIHNFIDGVSIGTAFKKHILTGISMSVAVLCEEFPHELGDFAVLISSGMSFKKALGFNFLSACMCYVGLIVGILVGSIDQASNVVFGIAGGMFLYIPLANMVPEMSDQVDKTCSYSIKKGITMFLLQNIGMLVGTVILFLLSYYDQYFEFV